MSSAKPAKENSSLQNTRQMLDELDALMERMLSLPVSDLDSIPDVPPEHTTPPTRPPHIPVVRMPTVSATLTVLESPDQDADSDAAPEERSGVLTFERPSYISYDSPPPEQAPAPSPSAEAPIKTFLPPPEPVPEEAIPPSILSLSLPASLPPLRPLKFRRFRWANVGLFPLALINAAFDRATMLLGWPGRLFRTRLGKNFLGLAGLVLLAWAGLWLLKDWLGWTW